MNAVEIEEAVSALAMAPFDAAQFPFSFLEAFGRKETTIKRLRAGSSSTSDVPGGVLERNNIHLASCAPGNVSKTLTALRTSQKTAKGKAKFILATDGTNLEAEELASGEIITCAYADLANHFGFFLPLAGISTVAEIKNNPIDIKATSRLNKLYLELMKTNPDWATAARRQELNQFMARLIFCFFAEDTGIFMHEGMFTACMQQMSAADSSNTHEVIKELFRAMDTKPDDRQTKAIKSWANAFPYVNGGLFTHQVDCPRFTKIARSYLLRAGELSWKQINPDIFGSMIQAVADDDERGELGMHYTSVPNILKVLDPLFLDDLRDELDKAEDNARKLLNLRKRIANIRVFDPACGSGNFLVIAYIKMREIEAEVVRRRGERDDPKAHKTWIKLTNFYGIEIKSFAAEVARLSLLIAEFQCNVRLIGQREACLDVLPLHDTGRIHTGNALTLDWLDVCPPPPSLSVIEEDLAGPTGKLALDAAVTSVETYICGNPPYSGKGKLTSAQKDEMKQVFSGRTKHWGYIDYVGCWLLKAADHCRNGATSAALVSTNSIHMGRQAPTLWPTILQCDLNIRFAHTSFPWRNNAMKNAAVICVVVGIDRLNSRKRYLFDGDTRREVEAISPYLTPGEAPYVIPRGTPFLLSAPPMILGNMPNDGGALSFDTDSKNELLQKSPQAAKFLRRFYGSKEFNNDIARYCLWISDEDLPEAKNISGISERLALCTSIRSLSPDPSNRKLADRPHQMREFNEARARSFIIPRMTSERREYLPCGITPQGSIISSQAFTIFDADLWVLSLLLSKLHFVWVATICGKFKEDYRYSSDMGWHTFPFSQFTENQKTELTRCAEDILLAREAHFPATIADLYDPETMPAELRAAHNKNDETLERIYIGRRFKNDTERLEKLFDMYTKMTKDEKTKTKGKSSS